jgi:hypothetical protein
MHERSRNPWKPSPYGDIILGTPGEMCEAHLGIDKYGNDLVELRYRSRKQRIKEGMYMRNLQRYKGIPKLYYEGDKIIVTERLYPLPSEKQSLNVVCSVGLKIIDLLKVLYRHGICHNHIEYFTFYKNDDIYFIDNRLWKAKPDCGGNKDDVVAGINVLERLGDNTKEVDELIWRLRSFCEKTDFASVSDYDELKEIFYEFREDISDKLEWD